MSMTDAARLAGWQTPRGEISGDTAESHETRQARVVAKHGRRMGTPLEVQASWATPTTRDQQGRLLSAERSGELVTRSAGVAIVDWRLCDLLPCIDGKARPVEPGTFPLAHGVPARVGRLRGYGNAIVPACAAAFIEAYLEVTTERL